MTVEVWGSARKAGARRAGW